MEWFDEECATFNKEKNYARARAIQKEEKLNAQKRMHSSSE
jgi:hypothetical protein